MVKLMGKERDLHVGEKYLTDFIILICAHMDPGGRGEGEGWNASRDSY